MSTSTTKVMKVTAIAEHLYRGRTAFRHNGYEPDYCCEDMEKAWKERFITFGDYGDTFDQVCCLAINHVQCYEGEGCFTTSMPIQHCPFCAASIEFVVMDKAGDELDMAAAAQLHLTTPPRYP